MNRLIVTCFLICGAISVFGNDVPDFMLLVPKTLTAGTNAKVCLTVYNTTSTGKVNIKLSSNNKELLAKADGEIEQDLKCFELAVPLTTESEANVELEVSYGDKGEIKQTKQVKINKDYAITLIETDKAVYKPDQSVKFRILTINNNLQPLYDALAKVWIENPSGTRLAQWLDVPVNTGLVQLEFELSSEPALGTWKIYVARSNTSGSEVKTFKIEKYVLPRFEVTINHAPSVVQDADVISYSICAKYSYGKPVKGELEISIVTDKSYGRRVQKWDAKGVYNYTKRLDSADGCYKLDVTGKELEMDLDGTSKITVSASVKEDGVDEVENVKIEQDVKQQALDITYESTNYIKVGVPSVYKIKAVKTVDNSPASNEILEVCVNLNETKCQNFTTNEAGITQFVLPPLHGTDESFQIKTRAVNYPEKKYINVNETENNYYDVSMRESTNTQFTTSWTSPTNSFIDLLSNDNEIIACGTPLKYKVYYTLPVDEAAKPIKFTYMVQSKGAIVQTGTTTPEVKETTAEAIVNGNDLLGVPVFKLLQDVKPQNKLYEFELSIDVTPQMSPNAKLLIFYTRPDREVVSTSKELKIDECFQNQVKANWKNEEVYPGETAELEVKASDKSLCSISAVDKSTSFLGKSSKISKSQIFESLKRFEINERSDPVQRESFHHCAKYVEPGKANATDSISKPSYWDEYVPSYSDKDAVDAFDQFGVVILSNLTFETRKCVHRPYMRMNGLGGPLPGVPMFARRTFHMAGPWLNGPVALLPDGEFISSPAPPGLFADAFGGAIASGAGGAPVEMTGNDFAERAAPVRSFFPETWLWDLEATDENGHLVVDRDIPHTITNWLTTVTCLSKSNGIGVSNQLEIRAFQPFFLEYVTPYSVKRGEILHLKAVVFNYLDHALPIRMNLEQSEEISLVEGEQATVSACVESNSNLIHTFKIKASKLGDVNVTISAKVDTNFKDKCGEERKVKGVTHRDVIVKPIKVEPEGYPVEVLQATYVCPKDNTTGPVVRSWDFKLPEDVVEDSARGKVMAIGEIMGPALQNLDRLVQIPTGCGEQNMLLFTPNLHVLNYLESLKIENPKLKEQALKNMKTGYEREQNYRRKDASFSAFGQSDDEGSLWLTAFVVRSFAQSKSYIFVDEDKLKESMKWIIGKQKDNGCFPTVGLVIHKDLLGGLQRDESNSALTAYVLASLLETGLPVDPSVIEGAKTCLGVIPEDKLDVYTMALTAYALSLANKTEESNNILDKLVAKVKKEDDDLVYWDNEGSTALELSIEITSYVILTMIRTHNEKYTSITYNAIRWISSHRNENGGFVSTQDTILALEALSKYAAALSAENTDIAVKIKATGVDQPLAIKEADKMVLKQIPLPTLPTNVEITTSGEGCVLLQGVLRYNTHSIQDSHAFGLDIHIDSSQDSCTTQNLKICTWFKLENENTNMAIMEVRMPTGYKPVDYSLESLTYEHKNVKRFEKDEMKVVIYFSELSKARTCLDFQIEEEVKVEKRSAANVKVYDYYNQKLQESSNYKLEESCHAKNVPHNEGIRGEEGILPIPAVTKID